MIDIHRCYEILGVPKEATIEDISKQHKDLVNVWHPDRFTGNPRLQKKAEENMAEINAAYDTLVVLFKSGHPSHGFNDQAAKPQDSAQNSHGEYTPKGAYGEEDKPYHSNKQWAEAKPKRSWLWRLFCLFSISLVASSLFIIPRLREWYPLLENPSEYLKHTVKSAAYEILGEITQSSEPPSKFPAVKSPAKIQKPPPLKHYVELTMDSGNVIIARSYRIENDMLVYQLEYGWVGVPRSKVKSIKVRKAASN